MASAFKAVAPAELDPNLQRGHDYFTTKAAILRDAAFNPGAPTRHLLAAAERASKSAKEIANEQPVLAAYAKGDKADILDYSETRENGIKVNSLTPVAIGQNDNSHLVTVADFSPTIRNTAIETAAFWEAAKQGETKTVQLPESLTAKIASDVIAFAARAILRIEWRPGIEISQSPNLDEIHARASSIRDEISRPIEQHLQTTANNNFTLQDDEGTMTQAANEIAEVQARADFEQAAFERTAYYENLTREEAIEAATTYGADGTITVDYGKAAEEQQLLMIMKGY